MIKKSARNALSLILLLALLLTKSYSQLPYNLVDRREHSFCQSCKNSIGEKPKEVLFGLQINADGDIYFSMTDRQWFDKIFKNDSYGVTIDLVSKKRYECGSTISVKRDYSLPLGTILPPVYRKQLLNDNEFLEGGVFAKIGKLPQALKGQQIEGNLVVLNGNFVCYYTNFVNIARSVWQLLPMGLFTDSLIRDTKIYGSNESDFFTYTKKEQLIIPFKKGSAAFSANYLRHFFDSINLGDYNIRKTEVRAYSSIEGDELLNKALMKKRADTIIKVLKLYQPDLKRIKIITAENWLEFFQDAALINIEELKNVSKPEARKKLKDKLLLEQIESMLSKHRKAVITIYLEGKSRITAKNEVQILNAFKKAVAQKDIAIARVIQKEIVDQITDNKLPATYIDNLEVPKTKEFSSLLNDREVYKYLLKATSEYEALDNFIALQKIDPDNGHINYNVCALSFFMWQYGGDTTIQYTLLSKINQLNSYNIAGVLVKRMQINYHILKCEEDMRLYKYDEKDSSVDFIYNIYNDLKLDDEDIYSVAKYFAYYSRLDYAEEIVVPRVDKLDVSEDLIFFYINTQFYYPSNFYKEEFKKALLNAVNLNPKRYCDFFLPNDMGGASMQLLEHNELKKIYCETCR